MKKLLILAISIIFVLSLASCDIVDSVFAKGSEGLEYELSEDGKSYTVTGIGTCEDTNIVIPARYKWKPVTEIAIWAFRDCDSLTSVVIGNNVTEIGHAAFARCRSLTSVVIGNSVTKIGEGAFYWCKSLTSVVIPDSVTVIGDAAFAGCDSLASITVDDNNEYYKSIDGNLYTKDGKKLIQYAIGKSDTEFIIPNGVTEIGDHALEHSYKTILDPDTGEIECDPDTGHLLLVGSSNIKKIVIPDSVTKIGSSAFAWCGSLTSIVIPDSVTEIGNYAFADCDSLTSVVIPDSVTVIGERSFYSCTNLTSVVIGDSVTEIGSYAFYYCRSLTSVVIGDSVTKIGSYAFCECTNLTSIVIPDSVTEIGSYAFSNCDSLTIYCEYKPNNGWDMYWNPDPRPVVWRYEG